MKDLKYRILFERLLGDIKNELVDRALDDGRLAGKGISPRKARRFNEVGSLAKTAREARLVVEGANADGSPAQIQLQHLNLRVARVLPFTPPK